MKGKPMNKKRFEDIRITLKEKIALISEILTVHIFGNMTIGLLFLLPLLWIFGWEPPFPENFKSIKTLIALMAYGLVGQSIALTVVAFYPSLKFWLASGEGTIHQIVSQLLPQIKTILVLTFLYFVISWLMQL